jgi:two-component system, NtrC family, sensor kinase
MTTSVYWIYLSMTLLLLLVFVWLSYRHGLNALQKRIRDAREGLLYPVDIPSLTPPTLRKTLSDYNNTITTLSSMFRTVEECQSRVLNERNRVNAILQSLSGALITVSNDLNINMSNRLAEQTFTTDKQSLLGTNLFDLIQFSPDDRDLLRDSFLYKKPIRSQEINLHINNESKWFSLNVAFFSGKEDEMEAVLILLDVSENRHMQDALASGEKLIAMGQLAAGVAHELNTPLGNILGYIQLIQTGLDKPGKQYEYAAIVEDETRRCSRIINDLLNYARKEECSGATCDINQVIENLTQSFINCRTQRYGIDIKMVLAKDLPPLEGECGQLEIVFTNLITNAIQALKDIQTPYIRLTSWIEDGEFVYVSVEDNGPGIDQKIQRNIFDPFFTTKEVGSGTGLGLSISQALLNKRGAFIKYDNKFKNGARFIIGLPFVDTRRNVA